MTDLEQLSGPRDANVVKRFARRVEPTFGFVAYGVVYFFLSTFPLLAGGLLGALLAAGLGFGKDSPVQGIVMIAFSLVAWIVAWIPFVRWARRKREAARALVREGFLCPGVVATSKTDRAAQIALKLAMGMAGSAPNVTWDRVVFEHDGKKYAGVAPFDRRPEQGAPCQVLFHPLSKFSLAFSPAGRAFVTKVHPARE